MAHPPEAARTGSARASSPGVAGDSLDAPSRRDRSGAAASDSPRDRRAPVSRDGAPRRDESRPHRARRRDPLLARKATLFVAALLPLAYTVATALAATDPVEAIQLGTGRWALVLLALTLAITPLRRLTGWNEAIRYRRMLGLFAFAYAGLHLLNYMVFDWSLDLPEIVADVVEHRYITLGMISFLLMVPLAVTSTQGWIRRLGGRRWNRLHRLVYVSATAGLVHFLWAVKWDKTLPFLFMSAFALVLGARLWTARRQRVAPAR